jgi:cell division protein ZapA
MTVDWAEAKGRAEGRPEGREEGLAKGRTMSQVTVTINGRQFRMACEDGQEGHLIKLAQDLDERIDKLRGNFGEIGDARLTIMAALTLADELADSKARLKRIEEELASLQEARNASAEHQKATQAAISAALNAAAERIEGLTRQLNQTAGESLVAMG